MEQQQGLTRSGSSSEWLFEDSSKILTKDREDKMEEEYFLKPSMTVYKRFLQGTYLVKGLIFIVWIQMWPSSYYKWFFFGVELLLTALINFPPKRFSKNRSYLIFFDWLMIVYNGLVYGVKTWGKVCSSMKNADTQFGVTIGIRMTCCLIIAISFMHSDSTKFLLLGFFLIWHMMIFELSTDVLMTSAWVVLTIVAIYALNKIKRRTLLKLSMDFEQHSEQNKIHDILQDSFLIFNRNGDILHSNKSSLQLFNFETMPTHISEVCEKVVLNEPEVSSKQLSNCKPQPKLMAPSFLDTIMQLQEQMSTKKRMPTHEDENLRYFSGKIVHSQAVFTRVEICQKNTFYGQQNAIILIFRDVSKVYENISLQSDNRFKTKLLQTVTHDLRTPLNCILMMIGEALDRTDIPDIVKEELLRPCYINSRMLHFLVNDIVDLAKFSSENMTATPQPFSLSDKMKEVIMIFERQAAIKNLNFNVRIDSNVPDILKTDSEKLIQILVNLIGNSFKYTQTGTVNTHISMVKDTSIKFAVTDTGVGISNENIGKLSEYLDSCKESEGFQYSALRVGIGLKISQLHAKLLGSQGIKVESREDVGSTFSFELPLDINKKVKLEELILLTAGNVDEDIDDTNLDTITRSIRSPHFKFEVMTPKSNCQCKDILIVDDNNYNLYVLRRALEKKGFVVHQAHDGKMGYEKYVELISRKQQCSCSDCKGLKLIFLDIDMPIMNGIDALKMMRCFERENKKTQLPIIIASAYDEASMMKQAVEFGMSEFILKPVREENLENTLKTWYK